MKNRIIMTVGTSLLSSACWNFAGIHPLSRALTDTERRKNEWRNSEILRDKSEADIIREFAPTNWSQIALVRNLPAEMATLRLLVDLINADPDENNRLKAGDELFLLHSEKTDGSMCAKVQEIILTKLLPGVSITREPIANLDPADKSKLQNALKKIRDKCSDWLRPAEPMKIWLNLTGGYKATSMVISSVATTLNRPATIVYGHESSDLARDGLYTIEFGAGAVAGAQPPIKVGHVTDQLTIHSIF